MFKPLAMQHVELSLLKDDAAQAALLLANYGAFDPETIEIAADQLPEAAGRSLSSGLCSMPARISIKYLPILKFRAPDTVRRAHAAGQSSCN